MAKLVIQTEGKSGRAYELKVDKTTIGRVEDNMFQIPEQSISSHHCEVLLRGADVVIKDLDSTNGTFINGEKITEGVLKPGQTLRLGQVELQLETGTAGTPTASVPPPVKKKDSTMVMPPRGVSLSDLESGGERTVALDANKAFSKKRNQIGIYFWIFAGVVILVIIVLLIVAFSQVKTGH
ncbi:MAG: FHA domain-containing protein [Verrucomicrobiota bacterium]|jgi:pSer/pThr/pTyr-binding forkhead associated (FHA) protein